MEHAVVDWLASHEADMIVLLKNYPTPSIPGMEYGAQQVVHRWMTSLGLEVNYEEVHLPPSPRCAATRRQVGTMLIDPM